MLEIANSINTLADASNETLAWILGPIIGILVGVLVGFIVCYFVPQFKAKRAAANAEKIINDANIKAEKIVKNAQIDGKQTAFDLKQEAERNISQSSTKRTIY